MARDTGHPLITTYRFELDGFEAHMGAPGLEREAQGEGVVIDKVSKLQRTMYKGCTCSRS